jgi:predicted DNA-binding ribbon-helix-helix protein
MAKKYSVTIRGHRTSFSVEPEFYDRLLGLARKDQMPLSRLVTRIDANRKKGLSLSSAIRLYVLQSGGGQKT